MAFEVEISPMSPERFRSVLAPDRYEAFERAAKDVSELFDGRVVWNVNSTPSGGGVVELLVVIVHDPQPAGLIDQFRHVGAAVIWRCHVGIDTPNERAREAWAFLLPCVLPADAYVFSRRSFAWEGLDDDRIVVLAPSIDAFSPKNEDLSPEAVRAVLEASGMVAGAGEPGPVTFERQDGTAGRIEHRARLIEDQPLSRETPVVLQVSRWDALKDPQQDPPRVASNGGRRGERDHGERAAAPRARDRPEEPGRGLRPTGTSRRSTGVVCSPPSHAPASASTWTSSKRPRTCTACWRHSRPDRSLGYVRGGRTATMTTRRSRTLTTPGSPAGWSASSARPVPIVRSWPCQWP